MDRLEIQSTLKDCEFFDEFGAQDLGNIADLCRVTVYPAGAYVFRQGDFGETLYIIVDGRVALERSIDLGVRTGSVVIKMLGKGKLFGCWSALLDDPQDFMSSAVCEKNTTVLVLNGKDVRTMMNQDAEFGFKMLERLCFLLRDRIQWAYGAMEKI